MRFVKETLDTSKYVDGVFAIADKASQDPQAIKAVTGCLTDEDANLLTYKVVFEGEKRLTPKQRASYASSCAGNADYRKAIMNYILEGRVTLPHDCMATAGGTGALYTAMHLCMDPGDVLMYPDVSWGNYKVMANENAFVSKTYDIFDLGDLFSKIDECEGKFFLITNSPCENPTGHAYSYEEWEKIIDKLNGCGKEVVLLNDMAYLDYAEGDPKKFFELFDHIADNVLVLMAISTSKSFSYYGERLGALIVISKDADYVDHFINLGARLVRTVWSNVNNGAMCNVTDILTNHLDEFREEVAESRKMLKKRANIFVAQAKECGLPIYDYTDGFFVTIRMENNTIRDAFHQKLMDNHIYTVKVNRGIRIALCSVPVKTADGLAKRIKELM